MRILIVYMSHTGTVRDCVDLLKKELNSHEVDLCDLSERVLLPEGYDAVVLGGYIHSGKLPPELAQYLKSFEEALLKTRLGLFLCCGFTDKSDEYFIKNFQKSLRDHAFAVMPLGGRLRSSDAKSILDKLIIWYMRSNISRSEDHLEGEFRRVLPGILPDQIGLLAQKLKASVQEPVRESD